MVMYLNEHKPLSKQCFAENISNSMNGYMHESIHELRIIHYLGGCVYNSLNKNNLPTNIKRGF